MNKVAIFGKKGSVAKYDLTENKAKWVVNIGDKFTPSVISQYKEYILIFSSKWTGKGMIHCVREKSGKLLWSHLAKDLYAVGHPFFPHILNDEAYFMSSSKEITKLCLETGKILFKSKFNKPMFKSYYLIIISENVVLISNKDSLIVNKDNGTVSPYDELREKINLKEITSSLGNGTHFLSSISLTHYQGDPGQATVMGGGDGGAGGGGE